MDNAERYVGVNLSRRSALRTLDVKKLKDIRNLSQIRELNLDVRLYTHHLFADCDSDYDGVIIGRRIGNTLFGSGLVTLLDESVTSAMTEMNEKLPSIGISKSIEYYLVSGPN